MQCDRENSNVIKVCEVSTYLRAIEPAPLLRGVISALYQISENSGHRARACVVGQCHITD